MVKFKALKTFEGVKEKRRFAADDVFEMTVERSNEIQKNIKEKYNVDNIMERVDEPEEKTVKKPVEEPKKEEAKKTKQDSK